MRSGGWFPLLVAIFVLACPAVFFVWGMSVATSPPGFETFWGQALNASFTGVLALFTLVLSVSTIMLWIETRRMGNLARDEFIATHRPKIRVRFIQVGGHDERGNDTVNVVIVNVGESAAIVTHLGADLARRSVRTKDWTSPGLRTRAVPHAKPINLAAGEAHVWNVASETQFGLGDALSDLELCAVGQIIYRDENGVARETGFLRVFERETGRYVPSATAEEDHEYAD